MRTILFAVPPQFQIAKQSDLDIRNEDDSLSTTTNWFIDTLISPFI